MDSKVELTAGYESKSPAAVAESIAQKNWCSKGQCANY